MSDALPSCIYSSFIFADYSSVFFKYNIKQAKLLFS